MIAWLLLACGGGADSGATWAAAQAGAWHAADLHVHTSTGSNDTDGVSFVADHLAMARQRGLDLLVFTDHSNSAGSMDCPTGDVEDCPNQGPEFPVRQVLAELGEQDVALAVGVEISPVESLETTFVPTGHVGCLPQAGDPFAEVEQAVTDRPVGTVPGGAGVDWCQGHGGFASVNHPYNVGAWIAYDWTSDAYDGMEIYNGGGGGFDAFDQQAVSAWLCDLSLGRRVVGVGGSDCHRATTEGPPPGLLEMALGWPTTWIRAADGQRDTLLSALAEGRVVVSDPGTTLAVEASAGGPWVGPGESIAAGTLTVRLHGTLAEDGSLLQVLSVDTGDCTEDPRWTGGGVPEVAPAVLHEEALSAGDFDRELVLDAPEGLLLARLWPGDPTQTYGVALANPLTVTP